MQPHRMTDDKFQELKKVQRCQDISEMELPTVWKTLPLAVNKFHFKCARQSSGYRANHRHHFLLSLNFFIYFPAHQMSIAVEKRMSWAFFSAPHFKWLLISL